MNGATLKPPTVRFVGSLLPPGWTDQRATLEAAARLDELHGGNATTLLLDAWHAWHCRGEVPPAGPLRDLIATLEHLLGGVACETPPRLCEAAERHGRKDG